MLICIMLSYFFKWSVSWTYPYQIAFPSTPCSLQGIHKSNSLFCSKSGILKFKWDFLSFSDNLLQISYKALKEKVLLVSESAQKRPKFIFRCSVSIKMHLRWVVAFSEITELRLCNYCLNNNHNNYLHILSNLHLSLERKSLFANILNCVDMVYKEIIMRKLCIYLHLNCTRIYIT